MGKNIAKIALPKNQTGNANQKTETANRLAVSAKLFCMSRQYVEFDSDISHPDMWRQIGAQPLLSKQEEIALAKQIEAGKKAEAELSEETNKTKKAELEKIIADGKEAVQTFWLANQRLVFHVLKKNPIKNRDPSDMLQEAQIGLKVAIDKYEWRKGYRFSTYATWWILQRMQLGHRHTEMLTIPQTHNTQIYQALKHLDGAEEDLPSDMLLKYLSRYHASFDKEISEGFTLGDTITDDSNPAENAYWSQTLRNLQDAAKEILTEQEYEIVFLRMSPILQGGDPITFRQLADRFGISGEVCRRTYINAVNKLKEKAAHLLPQLT